MKRDLRAQLRRLGVTKGTGNLKPKRPLVSPDPQPFEPASSSQTLEETTLEEVFPTGRLETVGSQACFVLEKVYPLPHQHGLYPLGSLLDHAPHTAALFTKDTRLQELTFHDFLFIDTETTGLGGAGTLAFMVGVAYFERQALVVRQYFLRDHGDEGAMLPLLAELIAGKSAVISFNGRSFDLPLLDNRFLMNRLHLPHGDLVQMPHLDLLHPSRRIWRKRLESCRLGSLEQHVLSIHRTHEDVPGSLIPYLYNQYLREGDIRPLQRVFYHNQLDMLSMVTLTTRLLQLFATPSADDHPLELLGLGKWQFDLGLHAQSEQTLQLARQRSLRVDEEQQILSQLAQQLKKNGRRAEAVPLWEQIALYSEERVDAHVELAKFYEWHDSDLPRALNWAEQAAGLLAMYAPYERLQLQELNKRLTRLREKIARQTESDQS